RVAPREGPVERDPDERVRVARDQRLAPLLCADEDLEPEDEADRERGAAARAPGTEREPREHDQGECRREREGDVAAGGLEDVPAGRRDRDATLEDREREPEPSRSFPARARAVKRDARGAERERDERPRATPARGDREREESGCDAAGEDEL